MEMELASWPGAFSVVMATGILAVGAQGLGLGWLSDLFLALAIGAGLALLTVRAGPLAAQAAAPSLDPEVAFGSLTFVAGAAVVGTRLTGTVGGDAIALAIWLVALLAWLVLTRAPLALLVRPRTVDPARVKGAWCLAAVAPFSLSVLAATIATSRESRPLLLAALALWLLGLIAWGFAAAALAGRLRRRPLDAGDFSPDWWITMGSLAIATVATLSLTQAALATGLLTGATDELRAVAHVTWWAATLLIPPLVVLSALRALRAPRRDDLTRIWSALFPLGMYAVASQRLALASGGAYDAVAHVAFWIAVAVFAGACLVLLLPSRVVLCLLALGLAAFAAGCADTHTTDVETVRGTANTLLETCAADRPQDALEVLDPAARQAFLRAGGSSAGCRELLGVEAAGTRVVRVVAGDLSARVELRGPAGERSSLELEKSRGTWYVVHPARKGVPKRVLSAG
jgi:hypothetical protein